MNRNLIIPRGVVALLLLSGTAAAQPVGPNGNLSLPPAEIVRRFHHEPFEITEVKGGVGGVMGVKKVGLRFADGVTMDAKWKTGAADGEGWNNSPRREIAAYRIQQFFLDPDDYVVPPCATRCIELDKYRPIAADEAPQFKGTRCIFGMLAAWLENVDQPDKAYDPERFSRDRRYAYHFAHLNLLTYLINHRDARANNFLMSERPDNPQVFTIDNGIAFGGVLYNFFTTHFDRLVVSGLPKAAVDRLRRVTNDDWQKLAVVEQLQVDSAGLLRAVGLTAPPNPDEGARWDNGVLQLGLTREEIDAVVQRAQHLLREIDAGRIALF